MNPRFRMPAAAGDFTSRLAMGRPTFSQADPRMVVQPQADPGYAMPNPNLGNLNQMPGQEVGGWLPAGGPQQPATGGGSALSDLFNTQLTPVGEQLYRQQMGPDAAADYDMRGAWARWGGGPPAAGHFPDTFKKPNHPTFSQGSVYSTPDQPGGNWVQLGLGQWAFQPSQTNLSQFGADNLQRYFDKVEPGNLLLRPFQTPPGS